MTKKMIALDEETHAQLGQLGQKTETFDDVVKRLIDGYKMRVNVVGKIRALAGHARSCHAGNTEMTEEIKKLEAEAIKLLGV